MNKLFLIASLVLGLAGCVAKTASQTSEAPLTPTVIAPTVTSVPVSRADERPFVALTTRLVVASGAVKPEQWALINFLTTGVISDVVAQSGDRVTAGDPVIQLDTTMLKVALQIAQQEVSAQQAVLNQDRIEAEIAFQGAGWALEQAQWELDRLKAQNHAPTVAAAQARVQALELQLAQARAQDPSPELTLAQVTFTLVQTAHDYAQNEYQEALDRSWETQEARDRYAALLQQAGWELARAQAQLDGAKNDQQAHAIGLSALAAQRDVAQAELKEALSAQKAYSVTLESLAAQISHLQTQVDQASDPQTGEAEARLEQARLAVRQIELQIEQAHLRAPLDGTVVAVWAQPGQTVAPNQPAFIVADLDHLGLETTELSQFDLARIEIDQPATVRLDAFPDLALSGRVTEVRLQALEADQTTYVVRIALDVPEALRGRLRWGMTGVVEITLSE